MNRREFTYGAMVGISTMFLPTTFEKGSEETIRNNRKWSDVRSELSKSSFNIVFPEGKVAVMYGDRKYIAYTDKRNHYWTFESLNKIEHNAYGNTNVLMVDPVCVELIYHKEKKSFEIVFHYKDGSITRHFNMVCYTTDKRLKENNLASPMER